MADESGGDLDFSGGIKKSQRSVERVAVIRWVLRAVGNRYRRRGRQRIDGIPLRIDRNRTRRRPLGTAKDEIHAETGGWTYACAHDLGRGSARSQDGRIGPDRQQCVEKRAASSRFRRARDFRKMREMLLVAMDGGKPVARSGMAQGSWPEQVSAGK